MHGEVHFEEEVIRQSVQKEKENKDSNNISHNSPDMKETLKRTNTPNFRKNFNYEPKNQDEDSNKLNLDHEQEEDNSHDLHKKPLMKVPTFSRNITNQVNNKRNPPKTNSFVVETQESQAKTVISLEQKEVVDIKNLENLKMKSQISEKDNEINQNGQQSPQRTRFFPTGKHKEHKESPSPQNLNSIPLKTINSTGSNFDNKSPSNQSKSPSNQKNEGKSPSNQKNEGKSPSNYKNEGKSPSNQKSEGKSPSNQKSEAKSPSIQKIESKNTSAQKINTEGTDSHKSLDKICEEESELASPEKKKSKNPSVLTTGTNTIPTKTTVKNSPINLDNKDMKNMAFSNNFKTNLIDFFRNEPNNGTTQNSSSTSNNNNNEKNVPASVFSKNSKRNLAPKTSQQSIPSNNEIALNTNNFNNNKIEMKDLKKNGPGSKFFHINPNANLISMFKNELETQNLNLGEDDNHNFVTIDDDGPSPINRPPIFHNDLEPERETSLNISTFENVCSNDVTNSNIEKSEINRTTLNNVDDISKDLSKYSINADYLNVEYDDKKGNKDRDPSPSNGGNILSGLNSPLNNHQATEKTEKTTTIAANIHQKTLGFTNMKSSSKIHKAPQNVEEKKFLSPTVSKKMKVQGSVDKFKLRSLTMKDPEDSGGEEKSQNDVNVNNISTNNNQMLSSTISPTITKKPENNKLDNLFNKMPKSPSSMVSARLARAKTTLEAENSVIHTSKLDITKDEQGNKKINQYLMIKDLGK